MPGSEPAIGLGAALVVLGIALAIGAARLFRRLPRLGEPRSFHPLLLPAAVLVYLLSFLLARALFLPRDAGAATEIDLRAFARVRLVIAAAQLLFVAGWTRAYGTTLADFGFSRRHLGGALALALVFYVACAPLQYGVFHLERGISELLGRTIEKQRAVIAFTADPTLHTDPLVLLGIVVAAPLDEEILFRGILQRVLARWLPSWAAIGGTALLFALQHDAGRIPGFVLGVALSWLLARTGNLFAPLLFHMVHNGLTLAQLATMGDA